MGRRPSRVPKASFCSVVTPYQAISWVMAALSHRRGASSRRHCVRSGPTSPSAKCEYRGSDAGPAAVGKGHSSAASSCSWCDAKPRIASRMSEGDHDELTHVDAAEVVGALRLAARMATGCFI